MNGQVRDALGRRWWVLVLAAALAGYWLLPISGQVIVIPGDETSAIHWPRMHVSPAAPQPGQEYLPIWPK